MTSIYIYTSVIRQRTDWEIDEKGAIISTCLTADIGKMIVHV